jgi:hypothetical protein
MTAETFSLTFSDPKVFNERGDMYITGSSLNVLNYTVAAYTGAFQIPTAAHVDHCFIHIMANADAVSNTNVDFGLYGALVSGGSKFLLVDAPMADLTGAGVLTTMASLDINLYPARYYYFSVLTDTGSEAANTLTITVIIPAQP